MWIKAIMESKTLKSMGKAYKARKGWDACTGFGSLMGWSC
jgi:hypothetical protein